MRRRTGGFGSLFRVRRDLDNVVGARGSGRRNLLSTAGRLARDFFPRLRGGRVPGQSSRFCRRRSWSDGLGVLENRRDRVGGSSGVVCGLKY